MGGKHTHTHPEGEEGSPPLSAGGPNPKSTGGLRRKRRRRRKRKEVLVYAEGRRGFLSDWHVWGWRETSRKKKVEDRSNMNQSLVLARKLYWLCVSTL